MVGVTVEQKGQAVGHVPFLSHIRGGVQPLLTAWTSISPGPDSHRGRSIFTVLSQPLPESMVD